MENKRNHILDAAKGFAIILVVLGHSICQVSGLENREALDLYICRFIVSFHMPLFMFISGFLFYNSLKRRNEKAIIIHRASMFVWPIITMSFIHFFRSHIYHFDWSDFLSVMPQNVFNSLWFFWALLIITMLMCFVHRCLGDSLLGYVLVFVVTLLLPDVYPLRAYLFLFPCFIVSYLCAKNIAKRRISYNKNWGGENWHKHTVCSLFIGTCLNAF